MDTFDLSYSENVDRRAAGEMKSVFKDGDIVSAHRALQPVLQWGQLQILIRCVVPNIIGYCGFRDFEST